MKKLLVFVMAVSFTAVFAQEEEAPKDGWTKTGTFGVMLNQSSFSNWVAGGDNAIAGNANINYDANMIKGDWTWDNKFIAAYGLSNTESKGTIKTDDRFEINSLAGKKAKGYWSYSFFANFLTQFTDGFNYVDDPDATTPISKMFAPAYLSFGPGMLWKKSDNFKINISPATGKFTFVTDKTLSDLGAFGVDPGETIRTELGFNVGAYHKTDLMKNVSMENILNLYSNYMDHPEYVDVNHQLNIAMQVNKYISANLSLHTLFDKDMTEGMDKDIQFKEVFGVGFNYTF
jgi:hypothetical protein